MSHEHQHQGSKDIFENICDLVENQEDSEGENGGKIDKMLVHFFLRCVNANPDTPFLDHIMKKLCSFAKKETLKHASPILYRILVEEESKTFEDVQKIYNILRAHKKTFEQYRLVSLFLSIAF